MPTALGLEAVTGAMHTPHNDRDTRWALPAQKKGCQMGAEFCPSCMNAVSLALVLPLLWASGV